MDRAKQLAKQFAKQLLFVASVLVLVGLVVKVTMPKAVHAAVAALVQVANTPTNPVPTADVNQAASQIVTINCSSTFGGQTCVPVNSTGDLLFGTIYTVPAGQTLVITDADVLTDQGTGICGFSLIPIGGPLVAFQGWNVPRDGATHQFSYHHGIVWPAGAEVKGQIGCSGFLEVFLRGYLTPN